MVAQAGERGAEIGHALLFLLQHGGWGLGDEGFVAELAFDAAAAENVELAALDYLRTAILFADVKDAAILGEATYKAAAALEQLRDPRAKDLYKKVVSDYGASPYAAQARGKI